MKKRDTQKITKIYESEHFVIIRPPRRDTRASELLDDLEFILSRGFRPLSFTKLYDKASGLGENAVVCERLANRSSANH